MIQAEQHHTDSNIQVTQHVSGGFLVMKNKFLFGKRSRQKTWAPKTWDIIGGHAWPDEEPLQTLKREAKEELDIKVLSAKLLTSINVWDESTQKYFRYHIFMITLWKGEPYNATTEHSKIRWFTREELAKRKLAMPVYLSLIREWYNP